MARVDDYLNAKKIAVAELSKESLEVIASRAGFEISDENTIRVPFLDRIYRVSFPEFEFKEKVEEEKEVPFQEQVLILHYMMGAGEFGLTGRWIAYREIPGAAFYFSAFVKRAIDPLKKVFGQNISGLEKAAKSIKGVGIETGDAGFEFRVFPKASLRLILWEGDDEFPAEANILFDELVGQILSPEDTAWLAGMLVYRLIQISSKLKAEREKLTRVKF